MSIANKKKILFIHHAVGWGGAPNSMITLINLLSKENFEVKVLLLQNSVVAEKLKQYDINFEIAESNFYRNYYQYFTHSEAGYLRWYQFYKFFKLSIFWILSRYYFANIELRKQNFDIIHLNSSVLTDWLAPSSKLGKVIIHIREPFRKGKFDILHVFFKSQIKKYANHIIAISSDNADRVGLPKMTTIVYNNVDMESSEINEDSYNSRKVLYLGGDAEIKGFFTIAEALDFIEEDIIVYFAGNYALLTLQSGFFNLIKQKLKFIIRRKHYKLLKKIYNHPNAIVIGLTDNVYNYLNQVCCLVSPFSTPHFARPIIESYFYKKAVIGTDVAGIEEIILKNTTGIVVERNKPKELALAINELTKNPQKAAEMGNDGFKFAKEKFNSSSIKKIESIYSNL